MMYTLPDVQESSFELILRPSLFDVLIQDKALLNLSTFMKLEDFKNVSQSCRYLRKRFNKLCLKTIVKLNGVQPELRKFLWLKIKNPEEMRMQLIRKYEQEKDCDVYVEIQNEIERMESSDCHSEFQKCLSQIKVDVPRTFKEGFTTTKEGQLTVSNVLKAVAFYRSDVGYCQGMNFVAAALVDNLRDEKQAFYLFLSLLDRYGLDKLYFSNILDYSIRIFQLKQLFHEHLPNLSTHFKHKNISFDLIFSKFILTLFGGYAEDRFLAQVYDKFILEGWKSLYKMILLLLEYEEENLKEMGLEDVSKYLYEKRGQFTVPEADLKEKYPKLKVTNRRLEQLKDEYFMELALNKINVVK